MVEASSIGSVRFASDITNPTSESGIIGDSEIQSSDDLDIPMVDR